MASWFAQSTFCPPFSNCFSHKFVQILKMWKIFSFFSMHVFRTFLTRSSLPLGRVCYPVSAAGVIFAAGSPISRGFRLLCSVGSLFSLFIILLFSLLKILNFSRPSLSAWAFSRVAASFRHSRRTHQGSNLRGWAGATRVPLALFCLRSAPRFFGSAADVTLSLVRVA